jgi:hypothetical protein
MDILFKRTKEAVKGATTAHEKFVLEFNLAKSCYGMSQKEFAEKVLQIKPETANRLINGKKQIDGTYVYFKDRIYKKHSDKIGAYIADNLFIAK